MSTAGSRARHPDESVVGTLQSLIVAFVLAMTFRGFVTEGFVIPTGSMAPTLLGKNIRIHSTQTGWDFPLGVDQDQRKVDARFLRDPMLGPEYRGAVSSEPQPPIRMGDRILVLKSLFPFSRPSRFDVVVFKNPTNPNGEDGNYIKRLVGLPNESIWLVDGDVFTTATKDADDWNSYGIQRKPEHVQRAVWQPVQNADFIPVRPGDLSADTPYRGAPWEGGEWDTTGRQYRCDTAERTTLGWEPRFREINDWASYNMLLPSGRAQERVPTHDVRVAAALIPDADGLATTLEITGRKTIFRYELKDDKIRLSLCLVEFMEHALSWEDLGEFEFDGFAAGRATNVEFWHVDQSLAVFVDGKRVAYGEYDWKPEERTLRAATREADFERLAAIDAGESTVLRWHFEGSPLSIDRVRLARDLYYRTGLLSAGAHRNPTNAGFESIVDLSHPTLRGRPAFGTHPANLAKLGPDHFFMLGDNSTASSDSRLWGNPHPLVAVQIDPSPFVVHRDLLLGKAWVVYFPAPHSITPGGRALIPDFGGLRFIR